MAWITDDALVGQEVEIYTNNFDSEPATVLAVSDRGDKIKVRCEDGEIMVGNQYS